MTLCCKLSLFVIVSIYGSHSDKSNIGSLQACTDNKKQWFYTAEGMLPHWQALFLIHIYNHCLT